MKFSEEDTRELAISLSPEGDKMLLAQAAALMEIKGVQAYENVKKYLNQPHQLANKAGHTYRFWDFSTDPPGSEDDLIHAILATVIHLPKDCFRFLRVLDGYDVEDFGYHTAFQDNFKIVYVPLIAV